jgi:hypothetical protein
MKRLNMKLPLSLLVLASVGIIAPAAVAGQQSVAMEGRQKARPVTCCTVPPQDAPVMIAQANKAQTGDATKMRTIGVCRPLANNNYSLENVVIPLTEAGYYLQAFEHRNPTGTATATILQQPKHGVLRLVTEADRGTLFGRTADPLDPNAQLYAYLPEAGYVGNDNATIQVDFGGVKVNVKYYFQALNQGPGSDWVGDYCSKTGPFWKISSAIVSNGTRVS